MAGEGSVPSQQLLLLLHQTLMGAVMGMPQAIAAFSAGCPCVRGRPCALLSAKQQHLSLVNLLSLDVTWLETLGRLTG